MGVLEELDRGNVGKAIAILFVYSMVACILIGTAGFVFGFFGGAAQVATNELSPTVIQAKYEWFKDASAQLDSKTASVHVYQGRLTRMQKMYEGIPRTNWARQDLDQINLWESEVAGIKASYNQLAAEYNAEMVKWNWRFTNVGDLPRGATTVLPREYKPYIED